MLIANANISVESDSVSDVLINLSYDDGGHGLAAIRASNTQVFFGSK